MHVPCVVANFTSLRKMSVESTHFISIFFFFLRSLFLVIIVYKT